MQLICDVSPSYTQKPDLVFIKILLYSIIVCYLTMYDLCLVSEYDVTCGRIFVANEISTVCKELSLTAFPPSSNQFVFKNNKKTALLLYSLL